VAWRIQKIMSLSQYVDKLKGLDRAKDVLAATLLKETLKASSFNDVHNHTLDNVRNVTRLSLVTCCSSFAGGAYLLAQKELTNFNQAESSFAPYELGIAN
jgi:hypothetical protein